MAYRLIQINVDDTSGGGYNTGVTPMADLSNGVQNEGFRWQIYEGNGTKQDQRRTNDPKKGV